MAFIPMSKISAVVRAREQNYTTLQAVFRSENGAIDLASIMVGVIVIGLIGGVIAATVFAVIPWTQDNAAKQQLDSIHSAENASYGLSADPTVTPEQSKRNTFTDSEGLETAKLLAQNAAYCVVPSADGKDYTAYVKSASGKIWTAMNSAKKATVLSGTPAGACSVLSPITGGVVTTYSSSGWTSTTGLVITADKTIYATTANVRSIKKMTADGTVSTLAGSEVSGFADGQGAAAQFRDVFAIALGPDGNLYVADWGNNRIRMVTPAGAVTTVLGNGTATSTDGSRATATINGPSKLTFDATGNLYIAEDFGKVVRKMTPAGDVTTIVTLPDYTKGIGVDAAGNVYVGSNTGNIIMKITPAGVVSNLTTATTGYYSNLIVEPSTGIIYAANLGNHTVEKILPDGTRTVFAGSVDQAGTVDGTGTNARLNHPWAITMDSTGALIVSDNPTLRMIK